MKEPNYTLHFTRKGYETFGERYAEKMLELLKKAEPEVPPVDTSAKDTAVAVADSSVKDSSVSVADTSVADTSTTAIHNSKSTELAIRYSSKNNGHLVYDEKRHKVFISVEKNGRKWLIDVTGGRNR